MSEISCEFDSLWFQNHPNEFYNFDEIEPIHTFLSITKIDIPLKVPHLHALSHIY